VFRRPDGDALTATFLSPDGRTAALAGSRRTGFKALDVSRDPGLAGPGESGRLLVRPGPRLPASNPCVVRDADGREVVRVELPPGRDRLYAQLVADDRRLLTNTAEPGGAIEPPEIGLPPAGRKDQATDWALYDVTRPGGVRVSGGRGRAIPVRGTPWLVVPVETDPKAFTWGDDKGAGGMSLVQFAVGLHSALTGERVHEVTVPAGEETCGSAVPAFDPTGTRYALVTQPALEPDRTGRPARPAGPLTLRVREVASGRELWAAAVSESGSGAVSEDLAVFFDPSGRRVFVSYQDAGPGRGKPSTGRDGRPVFVTPEAEFEEGPPLVRRVWIGGAGDGTHERTLRLPPDPAAEGGPGGPDVVGVGADGRLLVRAGHEVQIWDPGSGERTHRLTGHHGGVVWASAPGDGTRLFALAAAEEAGRLYVWDVTTGRELLVLAVKLGETPFAVWFDDRPEDNDRGVWFDEGKVFVPGPDGVQVFDGSPMGP
jgi:hypothetical protein